MAHYYQNVSLKDIKKLSVAYQTKTMQNSLRINSMDFHFNGEMLVYNSSEHIIILELTDERVYDSSYNIKHGAGLCRFVDDLHIVHTSNDDHKIRLLSLDTKNYVRYFPGHAREVNSISVYDSSIASGSRDSSMRLWDVRVQLGVRRLEFPSPLVAFHPSGSIVAIAHSSTVVEFYDTRNFDKSLSTFKFDRIDEVEWTSIKFSQSGSKLMITTNSTSIIIINTLTGQELHNFRDYKNPKRENIGACFATESNFVIGGSSEGLLHVWNCETSSKVHVIKSYLGNNVSSHVLAFNPKFMNLAVSTGNSVQLWHDNH